MSPARRNPVEFVDAHVVLDDGVRPVRKAKPWSRDKLGILASYLPRFQTAASKSPSTYFIDGMAGPGLYYFPSTKRPQTQERYVRGSTLIALETAPPFTKVIAMEKDAGMVATLSGRSQRYGTRAMIQRGDVNQHLVPLLKREVPDRGAAFVLLDPEGYALEWTTVRDVAGLRSGRKMEQLILVDTSSLARTAAARVQNDDSGANRLDFALPFNWRELRERQLGGEIGHDEMRQQAADLYCAALRDQLGYAHAFSRAITRKNPSDPAVYHLAFATDHPVGAKIMSDIFATMYSNISRSLPEPTPAQSAMDFGI